MMLNPATYNMYGQEVKARQISVLEGFQIAEWCNGKYVPVSPMFGLVLLGNVGYAGDWVVNTHDETFMIMKELEFSTHAELVRGPNE